MEAAYLGNLMPNFLRVEEFREAATMLILVSVAIRHFEVFEKHRFPWTLLS